jgi:hypothetical protein
MQLTPYERSRVNHAKQVLAASMMDHSPETYAHHVSTLETSLDSMVQMIELSSPAETFASRFNAVLDEGYSINATRNDDRYVVMLSRNPLGWEASGEGATYYEAFGNAASEAGF